MSETCCSKKQVEKTKDGEIARCVNPSSQAFLAVVNNSLCGVCPVRAACRKAPAPVQGHYAAPILPDFPHCEHRVTKDYVPICGVTGLPVTPEQCGNCDTEARERIATMGDKFSGYAGALKRWIAAGRPTRTEAEIKSIFEDHCSKCEMFDKEKNACKNCGCSLATTGNPLTNKLAMGTEKCPLGRW